VRVFTRFVFLAALAVLLLGCTDLETTDTGGVLLKVEFTNLPGRIGVNENDSVAIGTIDIESVVLNTAAGTSSLMDVLISVYEVTFTRADTGTRTPPAFVFSRAGVIPVGGTLTLTNFPIMSVEQMRSSPLADLLFENGGIDSETGSAVIKINATFTVFGKTVAGDEVASAPRTETLEFVPSLLLMP
jgi:hypothetical protein